MALPPLPIALLLALAAQSAEAPHLRRIAVADLQVAGVEPRVVRVVTDNLVAELRKLDGVSVLGLDEVRAMLEHESNRQLVGCPADQGSCLAELVDALGADILVTGSIADVDGARALSLVRIAPGDAKVSARVDERLTAAGGEELLAAVGPAVEKLFPDVKLRPGQTRGVAPEIARRLNPPPLPAWATLSAAGVVAGVSALTVVSAVLFVEEQASYTTLVSSSSADKPVSGALLIEQGRRVEDAALATNVLLASSVLGGAVTGVMALFTDWAGD